ncbi:MAG TPA: hypothetical protein VM871_04060 [Flavisolibacter sp.]|jgi:hypothetical protein|nr:hypothetical protein [Flavisolibacter sp.]
MKKRTLLFPTLKDLARFSKATSGGYLMNTCNLTITGELSSQLIDSAIANFGAELLFSSECAYVYDPVISSDAHTGSPT